jgi:hypothetical protein
VKKPNQPYEIETDLEGLNTDLAPELVRRARELPLYASSFEKPTRVEDDSIEGFHIEHRTTPALRCLHDDMLIWPDTIAARCGHLCRDHGYRMDGRRPDDEPCLNTAAA